MAQTNPYRPGESTQDAVRDQVSDVADKLNDASGDMVKRGRDMSAQFQQTAESAVRERPLASLAMIAVVGFVLGALWKS